MRKKFTGDRESSEKDEHSTTYNNLNELRRKVDMNFGTTYNSPYGNRFD